MVLHCWWKKSCTNWYVVVFSIIYRVLHIPGAAGFLPSTVSPQNLLQVSPKNLKFPTCNPSCFEHLRETCFYFSGDFRLMCRCFLLMGGSSHIMKQYCQFLCWNIKIQRTDIKIPTNISIYPVNKSRIFKILFWVSLKKHRNKKNTNNQTIPNRSDGAQPPNPPNPTIAKSQDATGDDWDTSAESFRGYAQTTLQNMAKWWVFLLVMVISKFYEAQGSPIRVK